MEREILKEEIYRKKNYQVFEMNSFSKECVFNHIRVCREVRVGLYGEEVMEIF